MAAELSPQMAIHLATVVPAIVLGAVQLARPKGSAPHRLLGRIWVALMLVAAVSSFWIRRGGFSWIHILSVVTVVSVIAGLLYARAGNRRAHLGCMIGAYAGSLGAGVGALAGPGRFLNTLMLAG
jgi:uncharacterized membrane protein